MTADNQPVPVEGLQRQSSGEQAAFHIRRMIFDGELRPGMRVPQDQLARSLGISRIPLREALIALEREGWVTNELHRGAFINALDEEAVRDHYELYGLTYGFAARRATERAGPELARELRPLVQEMDRTSDHRQIIGLSVAFHHQVVEAAHSPRTKVVLRGMAGMIPGNFFELVPGAVDVQRKGAAAITRAIAKGDAERAGDEYVRMMRRQGDLVVKILAARELFSDSAAAGQAASDRSARS